jgi:hypothetical protein
MADSLYGYRVTLYRYGIIAWVWRVVILGALLGGGAAIAIGAQLMSGALVAFGSVLVAPALFFGAVLAVDVQLESPDSLRVQTLIFWRRRVSRPDLGAPRVKTTAAGTTGPIHAPRAWIPVRGTLPIYFDLLGTIPDRRAFGAMFGLSASSLPRGN